MTTLKDRIEKGYIGSGLAGASNKTAKQIQSDLLERLPEKKAVRPTPNNLSSKLHGQPYPVDQYNSGYNQALEEVAKIIKDYCK